MKICSKCKIEKDLSEFSRDISTKDGLRFICKECMKIYNKNWHKNNKKQTKIKAVKWRKNNKEHLKIYNKNYQKNYKKSKANYDTFGQKISWDNNPVKNIDGFLQTRCTYCGKWYFPTNKLVQDRIQALKGQLTKGAEMRLYCSDECKEECPIYNQVKYPKGHKQSYSREVQPELRQMVFERDEHTCIKCGKRQDELTVPLHCHHIEGIVQNPIESADIDICVTVCKDCHKEIHQENGCGYNDMKCKTRENI